MKTIILGLLFGLSFFSAGSAFADGCYWSGGTVMEGGNVQAYKENHPPRGVRCEYEYRYCRNGQLSGSYTYSVCTEDMSCMDPDLGYVPNMSSIMAYLNSIEYGGRKCQWEMRRCYGGQLSGSYRNRFCQEQP